MPARLDQFDIQLLQALQANNQLTAAELADVVALSPSAIQRRLKRLRESGAIEADVSIVAPSVVGERVSAVLNLQVAHHGGAVLADARRSLAARPEVQICLEVTGPYDLWLLVVARSLQELTEVTDAILDENPHVRRCETSIVRRRVKATLAVPMSLEDAAADD